MILDNKTDTLIMEEGDIQESTNMEIDKDSHMFLMRLLSKFYSDGVGSLIRETCSNALDSHRECGSDEPIVVTLLSNNNGNYEFSVEDFGCGIDDQDVANIISKYGKSTKRLSVNQLGAFGLGFKSPLAYTSSFYFVGRKGGVERKWMLYESDDESNKIDLLYEAPTTERNGVKIIVPVKYSDRTEFYRKIREQLAYFDHVYFNCGYEIPNEKIKIHRHEDFQWSSLVDNTTLHICLDNVYYPIDWDKLGINPIHLPIGLRFSLSDGIFPIPNREQLKYTNSAKAIILAKLKKVATYFIEKYNEKIKDNNDIFKVMEYYQYSSRYLPHFNGFGSIDVKEFERYSDVPFVSPKLNNVKLLNMPRLHHIKDYLLYEHSVKYSFSSGRFTLNKNNGWRNTFTYGTVADKRVAIYIFTELSGLKKTYLRDTITKDAIFVKHDKRLALGSVRFRYTGVGYDNYVSLLELWKYPKTEWRERIKELQYVISLLTANFIDVDKIEIPAEWIESRKKQRLQKMILNGTNARQKKLSGEVIGRVAQPLQRWLSGKHCKFVSEIIQMSAAHKLNKFTIYGSNRDEAIVQQLFTVLNRSNTRLVLFSDREIKALKDIDLHNWMEISKFMEGDHIIFRRAVTAYLITQLQQKYHSVFTNYGTLKQISTPLGEKVIKLNEYVRQYDFNGERDLYDAMVKVAEDKNLFDTSIYDVYQEVSKIFSRLPFLSPMFDVLPHYSESSLIPSIRDLFKYYKYRLNWEHYTLPINNIEEEVVEEESI